MVRLRTLYCTAPRLNSAVTMRTPDSEASVAAAEQLVGLLETTAAG